MDKTSLRRKQKTNQDAPNRIKKMTPTESNVEALPIQSTVFDLDTMDEVTLKKVASFTPVSDVQAALAVLGNDSAKLIEVINDGLRAHTRETAKADENTPWMIEDEEGNLTKFEGTPADSDRVNGLILNMAKSVFGYNKQMSREEKKAAKEQSRDLIKNTDKIRNGLREQAKPKVKAPEVPVTA